MAINLNMPSFLADSAATLDKRYNVFDENPAFADEHITPRGSKLYWAIFAIMMASTIGFVAWAYTKPRADRIFHYITASITLGKLLGRGRV